MNMRPKLLDLFCGAGGCAVGYHRAGFEVIGVDIKPQPRYPFEFVQADALTYALANGWRFEAIHASPPCQAHSNITPDKMKHVDLIPQTRFVLESIGVPYVIENVYGAKKSLRNPVMLCGTYFGLKTYRHRLFESNIPLLSPAHYPHRDNTPRAGHSLSDKGFISITSGGNPVRAGVISNTTSLNGFSRKGFVSIAGNFTGGEYCRWAMGVDRYVTNKELSQMIPPAFTHFIGEQLHIYVTAPTGKAQQRLAQAQLTLNIMQTNAAMKGQAS